MKTLKRLFALVMVVVLMAGCAMKTNTGFVIDEKGKMSVTMIMAMDDEMIDAYLTMQEDPSAMENAENPDDVQVKEHTDAERWAFIESDDENSPFSETGDDMEGFTKSRYDKDGFKGFVYTKEVGSLDEVTKESAKERVNITESLTEEGNVENVVLFTKSGDTYKSNMKLDMASEADSEQTKQLEEYGAVIDMSFIVELPTKPISSNADSTENDGKTLKWNMTSAKNLEFEFKLTDSNEGTADAKDDKKDKKDEEKSESSDSNILLYVGIGVGALVVIGIIVAIVVASSKKKAPAPVASAPVMGPVMQPSQPVEPPVQPVQPVQPVEPPVQPVQPVQPAEPAQPVDPNNMNNPQV